MATKTLSKLSLTSYSLYNAASDSIANWSRGFILAALNRIIIGEIILKDIPANEIMHFGKPGKLSTTLTVNSSAMWWRVLSRGSLVGWVFNNLPHQRSI
jgi:cyclopropane-fatty-acyl-phospholipid synthase